MKEGCNAVRKAGLMAHVHSAQSKGAQQQCRAAEWQQLREWKRQLDMHLPGLNRQQQHEQAQGSLPCVVIAQLHSWVPVHATSSIAY
jgi:hypothetical protein